MNDKYEARLIKADKTAYSNNPMAIVSLVLGVIALLFSYVLIISDLLAILAIIFGLLGLRIHRLKKLAIAGLILSGISLIMTLYYVIFVYIAF